MFNKRKYFFLPPNLSINELQTVLTGDSEGNKRIVDYACLLYTVLSQDLIRLNLANTPDGYTQVHTTKLETIFGDSYRNALDLLLSAGLLEVNQVNNDGEFFEKGAYSKTTKQARSYRIPKHLRSTDRRFKKVEIETKNKAKNNVLYNKIDSLNKATVDTAVVADSNRKHVINMMNQLVLLDDDKTRSIIKDYYTSIGIQYTDSLADAIINKFNYSLVQEPRICEFAGRIHGVLTTIIKELRCQVRFADDLSSELVEIDIVASQPWFLSAITSTLIKKFVPECKDAAPMFKDVQDAEDVLKFSNLCSNTEYGIYEHLRDTYNARYGESFNRNDAKRICFRAFFSNYDKLDIKNIPKRLRSIKRYQKLLQAAQDNYNALLILGVKQEQKAATKALKETKKKLKHAESKLFTQKCYELFKAEFPTLHQLFWNIKQLKWDFTRGTKQGKSVKYYANNALLAQRLESNIVFGTVVKALLDNKLSKIITIHDAFIVRKQDEQKARKIIKQAFNSLKLKPTFK